LTRLAPTISNLKSKISGRPANKTPAPLGFHFFAALLIFFAAYACCISACR